MGANIFQRAAMRWRLLPGRVRLGVVVAVIAMAGLAWQHYSTPATPTVSEAVSTHATDPTPDVGHSYDGADDGGDGHARGEYQPPDSGAATVSTVTPPAPVDGSAGAARTVTERFASNFADPAGGRDAWLGRLTPDVAPELLGQYEFTDIRNVTQSAVTELTGPVAGRAAGEMAFEVGYSDGSRISVSLDMTDSGWKVRRAIPIPTATPPAPAAPAVAVVAGPDGQAR